MFNPRIRYALTGLLCLAAALFTFVATATRYNPTFEGGRIDALTEELSREIGARVRGYLRDRQKRLVLELHYTARDETYLDAGECLGQMKGLMELAAIRYTGFADEVAVSAAPSTSIPLVGDVPEFRRLAHTVAELRRRFDRKQVLESGDRRWAPKAGAKYLPWKFLVIHHSASPGGSAETFDRYHLKVRHWDGGLGYHFVIGNGNGSRDGEIEAGSRWFKQRAGAHAGVKEYNEEGIGVCLVGNFATDSELAQDKRSKPRQPGEISEPTAKQMESLKFLALYLSLKLKIPPERMLGHRDIKHTICPGGNFPMALFRRDVRRDLKRLRRADE
jgi:hypothetical protein